MYTSSTLGDTTYTATKADGSTTIPGYTPPAPAEGAGSSFTSMIPYWPWSGIAAAVALFLFWRSR